MDTKHTISKPQFESSGNSLLIRAPAKINLSLLVADKRPDGFHNIETIMAKISFYDELLFQLTDSQGIELVCSGPQWAPAGNENLVHKACRLFFDTTGQSPKIRITLSKNIPAGSGLGGASSDAASTLLALNKLFDNVLLPTQLFSLAASLGSDVPFFLNGPIAICSGRGEKISKIDKLFPFTALLILPDINTSTKMVYEKFRVNLPLFRSLQSEIKHLLEQNRLDLIQKICANMLAEASFGINDALAKIKAGAEDICPAEVCLSGSGSALFSAFADVDYQNVEIIQREIKEELGCNSIIIIHNQW